MLAVTDCLDALEWAEKVGGLDALIQRSRDNLNTIADWVNANDWVDFLASKPETRSNTSVCLTIDLDPDQVKKLVKYLRENDIAYDIGAYRDAPSGLRIWAGPTVEQSDIIALLPWITWCRQEIIEGRM